MKRTLLSGMVVLLISSGLALAADKVTEKSSGKEMTHSGRITKDDAEGVKLQVRGGLAPEFRREHIVKIQYECLQRHFSFGETLYEQGQYELALIRFAQAADDATVSPWAKQYVLRRLAQCHQKIGKADNLKKAVRYWKQLNLLIKDGKGIFVRESIEGMLDGYTRLKDWNRASACLSPLEKMGDEGRMMAKVYRAQIAERRATSSSDFSDAARKYKQVADSRPRPSAEVRARALAGYARCSIEAKSWGQANEAAKKILGLRESVPDEALAVAYQVLGEIKVRSMVSDRDIHNKLSKDKAKVDKVKDALLDMLRAVVQYKGNVWAEPRALYYVGFWSEKLERAGQGPKWQRRAHSMYTAVKARHPQSPWARRATAALKKMGG
jgi:TolA-binding protein